VPQLHTQDHAKDSRRIRLGIIGTGLAIEKLHWPALRQMPDRFEITAFADVVRPNAEKFARLAGVSMDGYHPDYTALLARDDVEAVLIALPIPLLYPAARAALEAGKHVVCEKPAGANLEQARDFLALESRFPDRKILIAENFFYRDDLRLARSLLDAGAIGRPHLLAWRLVSHSVPREGSFTSTPWRWAPQYRGGPQLDSGVHQVAQMRMLCGDVQELQAFIQYANPTMGGPSDLVLNLHFLSHAIGNFTAGHLALPPLEEANAMRLYGSEGVMVLADRTVRVQTADGAVQEHEVEADGGYYNQLVNFHDALVHDEPIVGTLRQSFLNLLVVMRALDSAQAQRIESLQDAPGGLSEIAVPLWRPRAQTDLFEGLPCTVRSSEKAASASAT
jgi:predicted dehydrogenase